MMVRDRLLDRSGGIEEPAVIVRLLLGVRPKPGLWEDVRQIGADRRDLSDDMAICLIAGTFPIGLTAR